MAGGPPKIQSVPLPRRGTSLLFSESLLFGGIPEADFFFFFQLDYLGLTGERAKLGALEGEGQTGCCEEEQKKQTHL